MSDFGEFDSSIEMQKAAAKWNAEKQAQQQSSMESGQRQVAFERDAQRTSEGIRVANELGRTVIKVGVAVGKEIIDSKNKTKSPPGGNPVP